jgi:hypothetical protein
MHTCDKRRTRSHLSTILNFEIEPNFTEEDELWRADDRETEEHAVIRANAVMNHIFNADQDKQC